MTALLGPSFCTPLRTLLCALLLAAAQRVASGRVLAVERPDAGGKAVWRVKILTAQGEVRVVVVDAASGRVVG